MEHIRRAAALLVALSLCLPQRSCVNGDKVEIHYPLSSADSVLVFVVIVALYLLPLLVLLLSRYRVASLLAGIAAAGAGLYYVSYGATAAATTLLVGWYTYTAGIAIYLGVSLVQLTQLLLRGAAPRAEDPHAPPS